MTPNSSRVNKWKRWLEKIIEEVVVLKSYVEMRERLLLIVDQSPVRTIRDSFWRYLGFALYDELVFRTVRVCEPQNDTRARRIYSLRALLDECSQHYGYFTRRRFVGRIHPPPDRRTDQRQGVAPVPAIDTFNTRNAAFDRLVGVGASTLDERDIQADIDLLVSAVERTKKHRDKFLAHNDYLRNVRTPLSYSEIPNSLTVISDLTQKSLAASDQFAILHIPTQIGH